MNKTSEIVYPKFSKRLFSALINFAIFLICSFCIDRLIMLSTYKNWLHSEDVTNTFVALNEEYENKQDEYLIYVYDENNNRVLNTAENGENEALFMSDSRVLELRESIPELESKMLFIDLSSYAISYVISSFGLMTILSFALGRGNSLGGLLCGIKYVTQFGEKPSKSTVFKYDLLSFAFHYVLSVATIGILPFIFLYQIYYHEKSQSLLEKWLHIVYIVK